MVMMEMVMGGVVRVQVRSLVLVDLGCSSKGGCCRSGDLDGCVVGRGNGNVNVDILAGRR